MITKLERYKGSIIAGAIGDAFGSGYENIIKKENDDNTFYPFGKPQKQDILWEITDDTQLTLATIEAISSTKEISAESIAGKFTEYYRKRKITGIGSSTLKALIELDEGGHWSLVGRTGEYAAGNGAAMRIAPLAFYNNVSKRTIKEISNITHRNDEAYIGATSVVIALRSIINETWTGTENLLKIIIDQIPDTNVRDRLIELNKLPRGTYLNEYAQFGNNGYVVNSIPLAIVTASKVKEIGLEAMFDALIKIGGDTDTICSIAGQVAGALIGIDNIPDNLHQKLKGLNDYLWIEKTINNITKEDLELKEK